MSGVEILALLEKHPYEILDQVHWDETFKPFWHGTSSQFIMGDGHLINGIRVHVVKETRPGHQSLRIWQNALIIPSEQYQKWKQGRAALCVDS